MAGSSDLQWQKLLNHPVVIIVTLTASVITIVVFVTGRSPPQSQH